MGPFTTRQAQQKLKQQVKLSTNCATNAFPPIVFGSWARAGYYSNYDKTLREEIIPAHMWARTMPENMRHKWENKVNLETRAAATTCKHRK